GYLLPLGPCGHQHGTDLQTFGRDFLFRKLLEPLRVYGAVTFLRHYFDPLFLAHFHARKFLLQTGDDLMASLGVLKRIFAFVRFYGFSILPANRVLYPYHRPTLPTIPSF